MNDEEYLNKIMKKGKEKAISVAEPVLKNVYDSNYMEVILRSSNWDLV